MSLIVVSALVIATGSSSGRVGSNGESLRPSSLSATCTPAQKARALRALAAYRRRMAAERRAYLRTHKSVKAHAAFVKRQRAKLRALERGARCTVVEPPPPPPPPPPPAPTPPAAPPAPPPVDVPATFAVGSGVPADQEQLVRRALALGNGWFRARLGRELGAFSVYLFADLEGVAAAYAEVTGNTTERARRQWETSTAIAQNGTIFVHLGSTGWIQSNELARTKILVHEAFHVLQEQLAGPRALVSGDTDVPVAGPRWLSEGAAEYIAFRAVSDNGSASFEATRARWASVTKTVTGPLSSLEIATGTRALGAPVYDISPLAVARLVVSSRDSALVAYWEAIGRGVPWREAFAAAFGRSVEAFYEEFEAYRRTL